MIFPGWLSFKAAEPVLEPRRSDLRVQARGTSLYFWFRAGYVSTGLKGRLEARWECEAREHHSDSALKRWMNPEPIIQSEESQKEKKKYCVLNHVNMDSRKMVLMNLSAGQPWRRRHREQNYAHSGGRRGSDELREEHWDMYVTLKPLTVWVTENFGTFLKRCEYQTTLPASCETHLQVKKQQLEPDMEQRTGSKLEKEYIKAVFCHPAYLT